ncbi:MAG: DNA gyrase inhibitor YacG [Pseudomonadota bacterium]
MSTNQPRIVSCPTCGKAVKWTSQNSYRPFCCERCKLIDFGGWADERNVISSDSSEQDAFSEDLK